MSKIEKFANSKFMTKLNEGSIKLSQSPAFSAIATGMGSTMGLIMVGAVIQIICAVMNLVFKVPIESTLYQTVYMPYKLTMGLLGMFMCFSLAYNYASKFKLSALQSGFTALVCFILVSAPIQTVTQGKMSFDALNLQGLGANGIFVAILVALSTVRITKVATERNWVIKMPDVIPEGVLNSFNNIIPAAINIAVWYGLSIVISNATNGASTLSGLITYVISIPVNYLVSVPGMAVVAILSAISWFFGIHGGSVVFTAIMPVYFAAYATNAQLAAAGQPLEFNPVFLYGALSIIGGSGNVLGLVLLGLKSKSKQIKAISKASIVPALFNISEPVVFGFPLMYNPILLIPFALNPVIVLVLMYGAWHFGLMGLPQVLLMTCLPIVLMPFLVSLDIRNSIFSILMLPVTTLIWYPFFKVYEKQCVEKEKQEELAMEGSNNPDIVTN
ncbi:PTS sugar transporter subunit IIC [Peptacetobacter sp.]|uniref:PTS sugar transporter subunit IIC n=1 Tax=Peptacetobacter sp. TaxID=2991975 RepID=UPI002610F94C|nr:PTS transporter subunit EIIC [Peptacetobacter sp.]